ncbi:diacylglycerol/lipid kinase family protein [Actinomadura fibrosa]|uniref:Diacylglycerol/lipid kinase family protein n=1 Tax=Actinomadura fibrosa TaxID=111802 RepID=A0ABW2XIZ2_9ACTN|nr:diacylglycerol kinase family protein [Actinomadura fibrosa]
MNPPRPPAPSDPSPRSPRGELLLFANAKAGTHDTRTLERITGLLRDAGQDVTVCPCSAPDDIERALDAHGGGGPARAVAVGGDGSINRLVSILHRRGELDRWTVGLVPMGTGNDLARNLDIPLDPERAARLLLDGGERRLDLIADDAGGVTLNAVHAGIGAVAAQSAARFKRRLKALAFPLGAVLAGVRHSGWRLRVEADGRVVADGKFLMVALSNASGIAGGTAELAADGHPGDGILELVVSAATGPIARAGYALHLRDGTHRHRDDVLHTTARSVTISGEDFHVNSDGEVSGPVGRRSWTLAPGAWRMIAPVRDRVPEAAADAT